MDSQKKWVMVRDKRYKLVVTAQGHEPYMLFDMLEDPFELNNLVEQESYGLIVNRMNHFSTQVVE